ncbi:MAG: DUF4258 domain-containing protein [Nitrospirae bacterium]|nr:DUF4258 domain-containing protein [Nitrospirota bacterium]
MPKNIKHSNHLLLKIELLKAHGLELSKEKIDDIIRFSDKIEKGHKGRLIAQKRLDDEHVLRVVYEEHEDKILVITVYPGRKIRYEKD